MGGLKEELLKSIWHAFTALDLDRSGKVSKSQLKARRGARGAGGRGRTEGAAAAPRCASGPRPAACPRCPSTGSAVGWPQGRSCRGWLRARGSSRLAKGTARCHSAPLSECEQGNQSRGSGCAVVPRLAL